MSRQPWMIEIRKILHLAIPLIISNVAMISMEVIDTIMAGQASAEDLAGLAIGGNIWVFIEVAMGGLITAITPRIARFYGANQFNEITIETQQALLLGGLIGALAMLFTLMIIPFIPLLGASPEVTLIAQGYTEVIAYSLIPSSVIWVLYCLLEGHGLLRFVVLSSLGVVILNIIFDYIFVFGKLGFPALGGIGCAWTTTTIYMIWAVACILYVARHRDTRSYQIFAHWPKINWQRWKAILALGIPISMALIAEEGFFNITTLLIAPLGTDALGAHQITIQIVALILMIGLGIGQATAIFVAQSIGRSKFHRMIYHARAGFTLVASIGLIVGITIFILRNELPMLFTQDFSIAAISTTIMMFAPLFLLSDALQVWAAQTLRGFEDTKVPMIIQIISYWVIGFPLGYSLGATNFWGESYGIYGFWVGFLSGVFIGCCLLCTRLFLKVHRYKIVATHIPQQ
ncbi:MAG: MATE family efflux transporter [Gammaproteobacteria bacterium]|nr:MATE family efflux transporter [Gammaproteobacteria bacterium]